MDNQTSSEPVGELWKYDPEYHHISDFLGVDKYDRDNFDVAKKMALLRDWGGKDEGEALNKINSLRKSLGFNTQGKTLVDQLFHHVRLQQDKARTALPKPTPQAPKQTPIQKTVTQAIQSNVQTTIGSIVQKTLTDKKFIEGAVQNALKGAIK